MRLRIELGTIPTSVSLATVKIAIPSVREKNEGTAAEDLTEIGVIVEGLAKNKMPKRGMIKRLIMMKEQTRRALSPVNKRITVVEGDRRIMGRGRMNPGSPKSMVTKKQSP